MRRGFRRNLALLLIAGTAAGGCTTPHHSNALIFGTNTGFGIDIGQSPTGTPTLLVGYRRQEAVFMPLVANVQYDANGVPRPCEIHPGSGSTQSSITTLQLGQSALRSIPPCFLVGQNGGAVDTYSVLASFGAQFSAEGTRPQASGGLAQFFATGLAAQALAIEGGPALVAVGDAAARTGAADNSAGIAALYDSPEVVRGAALITSETDSARTGLVGYLETSTSPENFLDELRAVESAAGQAGLFSNTICSGLAKDACIQELNTPMGAGFIQQHRSALLSGIQQRKQERGLP